jgi:hypothetical protein
MKSFRVVLFLFVLVLLAGPGAAHATGTLDQSQTRIDGFETVAAEQWIAQTFTAGRTGTLDQVDVAISKQGSPGPLFVQIRTVQPDGTPGALSLANATVPEASASNSEFTFVAVPLTPGTASVAGTHYAIVLGNLATPPAGEPKKNFYRWGAACGAVFVPPFPFCTGVGTPYPGGRVLSSKDLGTTWEFLNPAFAMAFKTYVTPVCPPGDSDDLTGDDRDEGDGSSGALNPLAPSGVFDVLFKSVQSDECDNDQNDANSDNDRTGSDGD